MPSTLSEKLFVSVCKSLDFKVEKVPVTMTKTPDFRVRSPGCEFFVEVKELVPNPEERRNLFAVRNQRIAEAMSSPIGKRAAREIDIASKQLKAVYDEGLPGVLVLFDNIRLDDGTRFAPGHHLEPFHIHAALFGQWVVDLKIADGRVLSRSDRSGPGERVNSTRRNYLSAVAVLYDHTEEPSLVLYHNPYASRLLPVTTFSGSRFSNYGVSIKDAKTPESWVRLDP